MDVNKESYLAYVRRVLDHFNQDFPNRVVEEFGPLGAFKPYVGGNMLHLAFSEAMVYKLTGDVSYAEKAREVWKLYGTSFPDAKANKYAVGSFMSNMGLICYSILRDGGFLKPGDEEPGLTLFINAADSYASTPTQHPTVGSMAWNHPAADAVSVMLTAQVLRDHPNAGKWMDWGKAVIEQSFNKPPVEDATNYTPLWFFYVIRGAEMLGLTQEFYAYPYTRYYFQYLRDLIAPTGQLPDFGDTSIFGDWSKTLPILEKAASVYRDGTYKTAAHKLFTFMSNYGPEFGPDLGFTVSERMRDRLKRTYEEMMAKGGWYATVAELDPYTPDKVRRYRADIAAIESSYLFFAYLWADDNIAEEPIQSKSLLYERRALLRSGLKPEDSYLLLSLEDWTKVHGHPDGNAVNFLCHGGSLLLHDAGYGGHWRREHNTVIWREGVSDNSFDHVWGEKGPVFFVKRGPEQRAHVPIFEQMDNVAVVRSQLEPHQRTVVMAREGYYVFDYIALKGSHTAACIYHTGEIVERGGNYYRGRIRHVFFEGHMMRCLNPGATELLLIFPNAQATGSVDEEREQQDEVALYQLSSGDFQEGISFSSVLYPVKRHEPHLDIVSSIRSIKPLRGDKEAYPYADAVKSSMRGVDVYVCNRYRDMESNGLIRYGDVETDADILYLRAGLKRVEASAVNVSKITYLGETITSAKERMRRFETTLKRS